MSHDNPLFIRRRLEAVAGVVAIGFALLTIRAFDLHLLQAEHLNEVAEKQRQRQFEAVAPRGPVLDRNGRILAESVEVPSIAAIARDVPESRIRALAEALGSDEKALRKKLDRSGGFVWLSRQVSPATAEAVAALNIDGIRIESEWRRFHPLGPETGHLIGFVGIDGEGLEGLERSMNDLLKGTAGVRQVNRDARGKLLPGSNWVTQPEIGQAIRLNIDSTIQSTAYAALADAVRESRAKGGSVVVMRPKDGAILAMASWPGYNPNNFQAFKPGQWRNRVITDVFEPGSTLKPFTVAAALESGRWQRNSRIYCEDGAFQVADYTIHDDHSEGWLDMTALIARSSNIGTAKLALDIGPERLYNTLVRAGFSRRSGSGLGGESPGILPPIERWGSVETANIAFGQGIAVTPLQLAAAFSVLANDGVYVTPKLLADAPAERGTRVFSSATARTVLTMLEAATGTDGTGHKAVPKGYRIAGKTGTAQKPDDKGGYSADRFTAVFAGIAPADRPEMVIAVVVDEPQTSIYGGQVAAPVFRKIAAAALPYLGVMPQQTESPEKWQLLQTNTAPQEGRKVLAGSLLNLSLREANRAAAALGYKLRAHGSGWVVRQQPSALSTLESGGTVEVWLDE